MIQHSITRLHYLCDALPPLISRISESDFSYKPTPEKWSKKEILGHLIDSATNNHQRFIRMQFEENPFIVYDQNQWNTRSRYLTMNSKHLIHFWELYNRHLCLIVTNLPEIVLQRTCRTNETAPVSMQWLIDDYVVHQEHHLKQIVDYPQ